MLENKEPSRIFGIVQGVVLVVVVGTALIYKRRQKLMEKDVGANLENPNLRAFIRRTPVHQQPAGPAPSDKPAANPADKLESAFPSWTKDTPPHMILGVRPGASAAEVEAAYKKLLKQYHPDRFSSWGGGYQTRAHHVVLLIQEARSRLLSGK